MQEKNESNMSTSRLENGSSRGGVGGPDTTILNGSSAKFQNGVSKRNLQNSLGVVSNSVSTNGHHKVSSTNGDGPHVKSYSNGNNNSNGQYVKPSFNKTESIGDTTKNHQEEKDISQTKSKSLFSPLQDSDFNESYTFFYIVVFGSLFSSMAAIGIVSAQDWLSFLTIAAQLLAIGLAIIAIYYHRALYIVYKTLPRDIKGGIRYAKVLFHVGRAQRNNWTVHKIFSQNVKKHPNRVCFYFEDQTWTFKEVDEASNRVGNYFASQGLKKGDSVALFLENRPEYVCIWLGLCKIGVIPALINFNLRLQPLRHCIEVAQCKIVIYGSELSSALKDIIDSGGIKDIKLCCQGLTEKEELLPNALNLDLVLKSSPVTYPTPSEPINFTDKLLYIFTSGTTGLPKAAVIKHSRYIMAVSGIHHMMGLCKKDTLYCALVMYHTASSVLGCGQSIIFGCTTASRKRFSASAFWDDCIKYNATAAQYIGEICRYLLSQPKSSADQKHRVRLMFGNGLRPQIWEEFASRFNIKNIAEFYGATEGNCNIINIDNRFGAVGFISRIMPFVYPVTLIRVDEITGEPIRDPRSGLVLKCKPNEAGELVGKIVENHPVREFQGYADSTATTKKIVRDVFRSGDAAFRTGDVLIMDDFGYFFFRDRTGDTYRWKGENVSTSEVEAIVSNACGLKSAVVFGVEVAGAEGKAGMAAILDPDESIDFESLSANLSKALPPYAKPLFIRIIKELDMTGTYKMKKVDLQKDGYDITKTTDKIYLSYGGKYILLENENYSKLISGQLRL